VPVRGPGHNPGRPRSFRIRYQCHRWAAPSPDDARHGHRRLTIWVDETTLHVLLGGTRLKTLPARLGLIELARLAADGARPAGPSPLPSENGGGSAIEVDRIVSGVGLVGLAGTQLNVGYELAGQRVTLRMEGTQMAVISHDGRLVRTMPCPVRPADRHRPPDPSWSSAAYPSEAPSWSRDRRSMSA
jgi:hypothetical protein